LELLFLLGIGGMYFLIPIATGAKILMSIIRGISEKTETISKKTDHKKAAGILPVIKGPLIRPEELNIIEVSTDAAGAHCPVCATSLTGEDNISCPRCNTLHHKDCWDFNGTCAVYGCNILDEKAKQKGKTESTPLEPKKTTRGNEVSSLADFMVIRHRFRRWFWVVRLQWWSVLWLCFGSASGFLLYLLGPQSQVILRFLNGTVAMALTLGAILWVLAQIAHWKLESSEERLPLVPPSRMNALLKRLENSESRPLIEKFVQISPWLYALMGLFPLVKIYAAAGFFSVMYNIMILLYGGFFIWMARIATKRHRAALERVRYRLRGAAKL
jgi:hypothetical protein